MYDATHIAPLGMPNAHAGQHADGPFLLRPIRTGIQLLTPKREVQDRLAFSCDPRAPQAQFFYCLRGEVDICIHRDQEEPICGRISARNYAVSYAPGATETRLAPCAGKAPHILVLLIAPEALRHFAEQMSPPCDGHCGQEATCRGCVRELASGILHRAFHQVTSLPLPLEMTLKALVQGPELRGGLEKIFFEYKTLELLYHQLSLFDSAETAELKGMCQHELDAAERAYEILLHDLASPPKLEALARKVGLTHTRLNQLFRALRGDTVFGVLRRERLECARRMLADSRLSVSEVAYECGFATPSHFSRAFLERYGVQPKRYQSGFVAEAA